MLLVEELSFSYGTHSVLRDISLELALGSVGTLMGPNASGKTTFLKCIAGLLRPSAGRIVINEKIVFEKSGASAKAAIDLPPYERGVGYVPSDLGLFPHMTLRDNIAFPLRKRRMSISDMERKVRDLADMLSISEYLDYLPGKVSRGVQQKAAIARALAPHPDILLLDEPFSSVDPFVRPFIRTELRAVLRSSDITALLTSHDIEDVRYFGENVFVLLGGRIVYSGPFSERAIMSDPMLSLLTGRLVLPVEVVEWNAPIAKVLLRNGEALGISVEGEPRCEKGYLVVSANALEFSEREGGGSIRLRVRDLIRWNDSVEILGEVAGVRVRLVVPSSKLPSVERINELYLRLNGNDPSNIKLLCDDRL